MTPSVPTTAEGGAADVDDAFEPVLPHANGYSRRGLHGRPQVPLARRTRVRAEGVDV